MIRKVYTEFQVPDSKTRPVIYVQPFRNAENGVFLRDFFLFWGARNDMPPKIESRAVNVFFMIFTSISIAQILKFKYFSVLYMAFKIFTHNLTRRELTVHNKEIMQHFI